MPGWWDVHGDEHGVYAQKDSRPERLPVLVLADCGMPDECDTTWQRVAHAAVAARAVQWRGECYDDADEFARAYAEDTGATLARALELWDAHATRCLVIRTVPADGWPEGSVVDDGRE